MVLKNFLRISSKFFMNRSKGLKFMKTKIVTKIESPCRFHPYRFPQPLVLFSEFQRPPSTQEEEEDKGHLISSSSSSCSSTRSTPRIYASTV